MTFYESNPEVRPVGEEPAEFVAEPEPAPEAAPAEPQDAARARDDDPDRPRTEGE
jgi:hypothetical protein